MMNCKCGAPSAQEECEQCFGDRIHREAPPPPPVAAVTLESALAAIEWACRVHPDYPGRLSRARGMLKAPA